MEAAKSQSPCYLMPARHADILCRAGSLHRLYSDDVVCRPTGRTSQDTGRSCSTLHAQGKLQAWVDEREFVGVESVVDAIEYMLTGEAIGKVVVRMP